MNLTKSLITIENIVADGWKTNEIRGNVFYITDNEGNKSDFKLIFEDCCWYLHWKDLSAKVLYMYEIYFFILGVTFNLSVDNIANVDDIVNIEIKSVDDSLILMPDPSFNLKIFNKDGEELLSVHVNNIIELKPNKNGELFILHMKTGPVYVSDKVMTGLINGVTVAEISGINYDVSGYVSTRQENVMVLANDDDPHTERRIQEGFVFSVNKNHDGSPLTPIDIESFFLQRKKHEKCSHGGVSPWCDENCVDG